MFKVLLFMKKLYQIVSIRKNVPCFVLLITGYFKVLYYAGQNCSDFKVFKLKVHHFKFIPSPYAKSVLAIIPGALLSQKFYPILFFLFCIFQLYIAKFLVCSRL